jgi:hypothetical protein
MVDINPRSRVTHFYVIYNLKTLKPMCLTASELEDVPDGYSRSIVDFDMAEEFINHKRRLANYFVIDNKGIAEFLPVASFKKQKRIYHDDYYIRDLNPGNTTFNQLGIKFYLIDNKIKLVSDLDTFDPVIKSFIAGVSKNYKLYITRYGDIHSLISLSEFDLYKLIEDKSIDIETNINEEHISLWATA